MYRLFKVTLIAAASGLAMFAASAAALPAGAPAGTTVECKDGTFAAPEAKSGACSGHKGVKTWYGKADAKAGSAAPAVEPQSAAVSKAPKTPAVQDPSRMAAAPGGGAGKVWVNESTKVYHCEGDRYYGKTKKGEYMTEAEARAKGAHASHKKVCAAA